MTRYLFAMWDGGGAVAPELGAAGRLVRRGHDVRILADPTLRDQALGIGATFAPWVAAPHRAGADPAEDLVKDWEVTSPLEGLRRMRDRLIGGPAGAVAADTADQIAAVSADVVVADYFMFGAILAAQGAGLPVAALVPNIWALPVRGVPPIAAGFPLATGPLGRARDAILVSVVNRIFAKGLPSLNAVRAEHGLPPLNSFYEQVLTADRILVLTSPAFDYAAPFVPRNVRYTGPVLDDPPWAEPWTPPWPEEDSRPLVLVGLSSTFQDQAAVLQRIIDALSGLPVRTVVTTGPMLDPKVLSAPGDVCVVRSAPHGPILERAALVVTHCGHGTTMKALAAGVPMVCIPMGRDQDDTAARVEHHGAGVRLAPTASADAIGGAVTEVLARDEYRRAAARLADTINADMEASPLIAELEGLASAPHSAHPPNAG